jgi:hypothetical protein
MCCISAPGHVKNVVYGRVPIMREAIMVRSSGPLASQCDHLGRRASTICYKSCCPQRTTTRLTHTSLLSLSTSQSHQYVPQGPVPHPRPELLPTTRHALRCHRHCSCRHDWHRARQPGVRSWPYSCSTSPLTRCSVRSRPRTTRARVTARIAATKIVGHSYVDIQSFDPQSYICINGHFTVYCVNPFPPMQLRFTHCVWVSSNYLASRSMGHWTHDQRMLL